MRLIDADALIERRKELSSIEWNKKAAPISWADAYEHFADELEEAPTVDAVEVVRCADCARRNPTADLTNTVLCTWLHNLTMPKDGFCNYGKRRVDDG